MIVSFPNSYSIDCGRLMAGLSTFHASPVEAYGEPGNTRSSDHRKPSSPMFAPMCVSASGNCCHFLGIAPFPIKNNKFISAVFNTQMENYNININYDTTKEWLKDANRKCPSGRPCASTWRAGRGEVRGGFCGSAPTKLAGGLLRTTTGK